ncbi:MAG: biotin--[Clostridia bacterium]|nr:biotin--[acetyl-CoA-carboxylase] ligase [Clostridia bacterium]
MKNIIKSSNLIKNVVYYKRVSSTNALAKEILSKDLGSTQSNFLVFSNCQTNGKGKNDAEFLSPADVGIYMTIVLIKPSYDLRLISIATSLAIFNAVQKFAPTNIKIKWPNDILMNSKKICGILIEASGLSNSKNLSYVIIGIGLNVNNESFDKSIEDIATSIKKEIGESIDISNLISEILNQLESLLQKTPEKLIKCYLENADKAAFAQIESFYNSVINLSGKG